MAVLLLSACALTCAIACNEPAATPAATAAPSPAGSSALKTDKGIDLEHKIIRLGVLNDESGPAAAIGKPYAIGKRILAAQIAAGGSGILPDGWTIELIERDHGYNPQKSLQAYTEIKDDVLLIAHSFGTPNTLPLRPVLGRDAMIALPASLSSVMAEHRSTIPIGPSYAVEAMRAVEWLVEQQRAAGKPVAAIKAAIVYQRDDYGQDGLLGFRKAAEGHGVAIVGEYKVTAGQRDFDEIAAALKQAGATHVMLTLLPNATSPLLEATARARYKPIFVGNTPTWIDGFFDPHVVPSALFANYTMVSGSTYWGENVPGMPRFLDAYEKYGKALSPPDSYLLSSYMQGLVALELIKNAIEAGDATRAGLLAIVPKMKSFDVGGLGQTIDLSRFPYVTSTRVRVLKPDFAKRTWTVISDFSTPAASGVGAPPARDARGKTTAARAS